MVAKNQLESFSAFLKWISRFESPEERVLVDVGSSRGEFLIEAFSSVQNCRVFAIDPVYAIDTDLRDHLALRVGHLKMANTSTFELLPVALCSSQEKGPQGGAKPF